MFHSIHSDGEPLVGGIRKNMFCQEKVEHEIDFLQGFFFLNPREARIALRLSICRHFVPDPLTKLKF